MGGVWKLPIEAPTVFGMACFQDLDTIVALLPQHLNLIANPSTEL